MAELLEKTVAHKTVDTPLVTTTETTAVVSGRVGVRSATCLVSVRGGAQVRTGASSTALRARIRRDGGPGGGFVSQLHDISLQAAPGGNEPVGIAAAERLAGVESVEYYLTIEQVGATGNGSVIQAIIAVEILSG